MMINLHKERRMTQYLHSTAYETDECSAVGGVHNMYEGEELGSSRSGVAERGRSVYCGVSPTISKNPTVFRSINSLSSEKVDKRRGNLGTR